MAAIYIESRVKLKLVCCQQIDATLYLLSYKQTRSYPFCLGTHGSSINIFVKPNEVSCIKRHYDLGEEREVLFFEMVNTNDVMPLSFTVSSAQFMMFKPKTLGFQHTHKYNYTNVHMKWENDSYFETIESIHKFLELKPIFALKNCIIASPQGCFPISDVSKKGLQFDIPFKVAKFLRMYHSVFDEFKGP